MYARPIHDRIIVKVDPAATKTTGGIALVEAFQPRPSKGEVLAVGPGKLNDKGKFVTTSLKPGDRIVFGNYHGIDIEIDGEKYKLMREQDVAGIIEPGDEIIEVGPCSTTRSNTHRYYK